MFIICPFLRPSFCSSYLFVGFSQHKYNEDTSITSFTDSSHKKKNIALMMTFLVIIKNQSGIELNTDPAPLSKWQT